MGLFSVTPICSSLLPAPLVQCRQPVLTKGDALVPKLPVTCAILELRMEKKKEKSNDYRSKTTREIISIAGINILCCLRYLSYIFCSLDWDMTQHSYQVRLNKDSNLEITKQMKD